MKTFHELEVRVYHLYDKYGGKCVICSADIIGTGIHAAHIRSESGIELMERRVSYDSTFVRVKCDSVHLIPLFEIHES